MILYYKHKENGLIYKLISSLSEYVFVPINDKFGKHIRLGINPNISDSTNIITSKINEIFDRVRLKPELVTYKPKKLVKVELEFRCPICGEKMMYNGKMNNDLYESSCTNNKCGFLMEDKFVTGDVVRAKSASDAYRIIESGTALEKLDLYLHKIDGPTMSKQ